MNRNEIEFYNNNVPAIRRALERIADALENQNQFVVNTIKAKNHKAEYEAEQAKLYTNDIKAQDDALNKETQEELDTQHDYLHDLVQDMDNDDYHEFCNEHCLPASDTVAVTNYITDLDYDEVLGIISDIEAKSNDQANEDAIELKHGHFSEKIGVPYDDDYDLRCTARMYADELKHGHFSTKKDCILDYVTNEFGSHGARYTDIIKFAYYLNDSNAPKFGYDNRGYYACAMTHNRWGFGHLVYGGKDFFVKGINKEGNERYFAHSFVESVTDYWKFCDNTK